MVLEHMVQHMVLDYKSRPYLKKAIGMASQPIKVLHTNTHNLKAHLVFKYSISLIYQYLMKIGSQNAGHIHSIFLKGKEFYRSTFLTMIRKFRKLLLNSDEKQVA